MAFHEYVGRPVVVLANDLIVYEGLLRACDKYTNLVLQDCVEIREAQGRVVREKRNCLFLRGDSVGFVAPDDRAMRHMKAAELDPV